LGRCLDTLYDVSISWLYQQIAEKVVVHLKLPCEFAYLDSTSFHYNGKANADEDEPKVLHITKGYSHDHRPELNQDVLNQICENQSDIPIYMQAANGNPHDMEGFAKSLRTILTVLKPPNQAVKNFKKLCLKAFAKSSKRKMSTSQT